MTARPHLRRTLAATLLLASAGSVLVPGLAHASDPARVDPSSESAWVVVREPELASYTPAPGDRANSAGGAITVTRIDAAEWEIRIPNQGALATDNGGHVQVSPMGASAAVCAVVYWDVSGADLLAGVRCATPEGAASPTPFVLGYVHEDEASTLLPTFGYAWLSDPSAPSSTPAITYQQDVAGGTVTATRTVAGAHRIVFPNIPDATYVGLTPYGSPVRCRTEGWFPAGGQTVETFCGGAAGDDHPLTVYLARRTGPLGFGRSAATAWASDPTADRSLPPRSYRYSSSGKSPVITRSARGVYRVRFPGQPTGGAAFVTAYGTTDRICQVGSIAKRGTAATVGVRCFRADGRPADSRFTIGWTR